MVFNEEASAPDNEGTGGFPYQLAVTQNDSELNIKGTIKL
jgi:hypothetical protein